MFVDKSPIAQFRGPWGVPIQIAASLVILPLFIVDFGAPPDTLVWDLVFVAILIVSILLHELGHAWGCLIQGVPVRRIMIHGGGGFCERSRSASRYEQELIVAMGPIVTIVLWAVAGLAAPLVPDPEIAWVLWIVSYINGFLAVLNLIPVQPLDGGRLFELVLHRFLEPQSVYRVAGAVGLVIAILWLPAMLVAFDVYGLFLLVIPAFFLHWNMFRHGRP
jgi:stage IV sporulation protein FB